VRTGRRYGRLTRSLALAVPTATPGRPTRGVLTHCPLSFWSIFTAFVFCGFSSSDFS
jgi:hypothetical protein